ncbi:MAG: single-stranded-DNA-specific exonuclease RecJ [Candidatus Muiribacteriota bacterium]
MKKKWIIKEVDKEKVNLIKKWFNLSGPVATLLYNRGIYKKEDLENFLNFNNKKFHSPFLFSNIIKSCEIIKSHIEKNSLIIIFGDYDVDGITSTALLYEFFLKLLNYDNVDCILPERDNGYGLNKNIMEKFIERKAGLIITVDTGICSYEEIKYAKKNNIDVIVTDHHEIPEKLPEADVLINPKLEEKYPFKYLAGVGVSFKLIQGYIEYYDLDKNFLKTVIDLAALGTIADIVPMIDENRLITRTGFDIMAKRRRPGIEALMKYVYGNEINSHTISFGLAPRINASGRVGNPKVALKLLLTQDKYEAINLAENLNLQNKQRRVIELNIMQKAQKMVEKDVRNKKIIMLYGYDWNLGVIGIVSSKIKEMFNRPAFLISIDKKTKIARGSARSIEGFNLVENIASCEDLLESFGGHEFAAGFTIKENNIDCFHDRLYKRASEVFSRGIPAGSIEIDLELKAEHININFYDEIWDKFHPFGEKNPLPVFAIKSIEVKSLNIFSQKHLSLRLSDGFYNLKGVYYNFFNNNQKELTFKVGDKIDIAFKTKLSTYNNTSYIELQIIDIKSKNKKNSSGSFIEVDKIKEKGNEFLLSGSFDRAINFYNKALKLSSNNAKIYFNLGLAFKKKGDKAKALSFFKKARNYSRGKNNQVFIKSIKSIKGLKS